MSAIWGCVELNGGNFPEGLCEVMEAPLHNYKIDRYGRLNKENVIMGCGIQYITDEAVNEPLPVYDEESGVYFTADCIVDNRDELIAQLCPEANDIPDGQLMFLAFLKWREDMPKYVLGAYSYAAYEKKANKLTIAADHLFNRSIYYARKGSRIFFSTLVEPILQGIGEAPSLNEEWLSMFLSMTALTILSNPVDTPYIGVNRVQASHCVVFERGGEKTIEYWSPKDVKPMKLKNDGEYREYFRRLMEKVSKDTLRCRGGIGILLSSGLDSATVAAYAEPILSQKGKKLFSYTYVPVEGHTSRYNEKYAIVDEREGVESICRMHPNIVAKFLDVPEQNAVSSIKRILPSLEIPYKSHTNLAWIDEFAHLAVEDGCKIMLTGQVGNSTISSGNINVYLLSRLLQGRFLNVISTASKFGKIHGVGRKRIAKTILAELVPSFIKYRKEEDYFSSSYINKDFARSIGIKDRDPRLKQNIGLFKPYTFKTERSMIFNPVSLAHVGEDETKLYLKHGMITRDITRDIRIFEFCLAAPMECFVDSDGNSRRLVRQYLSDKIPSKLLSETAPRGYQSDDWLERITPEWNELYAELVRGCTLPVLQKFIDRDMVDVSLKKFKELPQPTDEKEFVRLCAVYISGVFLEEREWLNQ